MSLAEVMVALCVLGIAMGALYKVAITANHTSARARSHYIAVNLAKNHIERAKSHDFDQILFLAETNTIVDINGLTSTNGDFRRSTMVNLTGTGMVEVVVTVDIKDLKKGQFLGESESIAERLVRFQGRPK